MTLSCYNLHVSKDMRRPVVSRAPVPRTEIVEKAPQIEPGQVEALVLMVSGRVQGVGFRWFAEREALRHGVSGYVKNLPDGRVEIWAQAESRALAEFCERVKRGPSGARVDDVERTSVSVDENLSSFRVRF
jgi:acylphosphatase